MTIDTLDKYYAAGRRAAVWRKFTAQSATAGIGTSLLDVPGVGSTGNLSVGNTANGLLVTDATLGYPDIRNFSATAGVQGQLASAFFRNTVPGGCTLYDRIFNSGSHILSALGSLALAGQPSIAARVPDLNYNALELLLEISAATGAGATNVQIGYTNQSGTTGRFSQVVGMASLPVRRVVPVGLQAGDTGIQRVDSVVTSNATNTGNFNVILARRLAEFDIRTANALDAQGWDMLGAPFILDSAALWPVITPDGASTGTPSLHLNILDG